MGRAKSRRVKTPNGAGSVIPRSDGRWMARYSTTDVLAALASGGLAEGAERASFPGQGEDIVRGAFAEPVPLFGSRTRSASRAGVVGFPEL